MDATKVVVRHTINVTCILCRTLWTSLVSSGLRQRKSGLAGPTTSVRFPHACDLLEVFRSRSLLSWSRHASQQRSRRREEIIDQGRQRQYLCSALGSSFW